MVNVVVTHTVTVSVYISAVNVRYYYERSYETSLKRYTVPSLQVHKAEPKLEVGYIASCGGLKLVLKYIEEC